MIKSIKLTDLNNKKGTINLKFNDDINILTGKNGSGKTTIMKTLWYLISGNIERVAKEIKFDSIELLTSTFFLTIKSQNKTHTFILYNNKQKDKKLFEISTHISNVNIDDLNHMTCKLLDKSVFFPTFRRMEGGYSIEDVDDRLKRKSKFQSTLHGHADLLSVYNHKFVSSISTEDIKIILSNKYAEASEFVDKSSKDLAMKITKKINKYKPDTYKKDVELEMGRTILNQIKEEVKKFEDHRSKVFNSIDILSKLIKDIFEYDGIKLSEHLVLGTEKNSIDSDLLSAGEKQMLSFLTYNLFYNDCPFFIDEPELSLHVDWQRLLIPILRKQHTTNQMIISTHSPFIYTQYNDKEICINNDKGYSNE